MEQIKLKSGRLYFVKDEYYSRFPNCGLMINKGSNENGEHHRPCCYCFEDEGICFMIPISSKIEKYTEIYNKKMKIVEDKRRNGNLNATYDGIRFGYVNGEKRAFLIQNIFPVKLIDIEKQYMINKGKTEVVIAEELSKELNALARKVFRLYKRGTSIVFTDLGYILSSL